MSKCTDADTLTRAQKFEVFCRVCDNMLKEGRISKSKPQTLDGDLVMFSKEDHEFIDFLFGKLTCLTDTEMIDLQDDDTCCDHLEFKQLEINDNV